MNDDGAITAVDYPDFEQLAGCPVGTDQHQEGIVELFGPYRVGKSVADVVISDPMLARALGYDRSLVHPDKLACETTDCKLTCWS